MREQAKKQYYTGGRLTKMGLDKTTEHPRRRAPLARGRTTRRARQRPPHARADRANLQASLVPAERRGGRGGAAGARGHAHCPRARLCRGVVTTEAALEAFADITFNWRETETPVSGAQPAGGTCRAALRRLRMPRSSALDAPLSSDPAAVRTCGAVRIRARAEGWASHRIVPPRARAQPGRLDRQCMARPQQSHP